MNERPNQGRGWRGEFVKFVNFNFYFLGSGRQYSCFNSDNVFRHFLGKTAKSYLLTMGMFVTIV